MDTEIFKRRLLAEEKRLQDEMARAEESARDAPDPRTGDAADRSVAAEQKENEFGAADRDQDLLRQVREALDRIKEGTYGRCLVDGGPIEQKRLDAVPWAAYCMRHQEAQEAAHPVATPSL